MKSRGKPTGWALLSGTTVLVRVLPDGAQPGVWRVVWPDGRTSDLVNLARAKDAAAALAERGPPVRDHRLLHWRLDHSERHSGGPTRVRFADLTDRTAARTTLHGDRQCQTPTLPTA